MKRIVSIIIVAIVTLQLLLPITGKANATPYYMVTPAVGVDLMATANAAGLNVAKLKQGARVEPLQQENGWTKVLYNNRLGWIKSDFIQPFTIDLTPTYAAYYKQLKETPNIVYSLIYDFTQDGIEDLYVVTDLDTSKGEYIEKIYSGLDVIYTKTLTDGLTIIQDATGVYIKHESITNQSSSYPLSQLSNEAKNDYYEVSAGDEKYAVPTTSHFNAVFVLESGSAAVMERRFLTEEVASTEYFGGQVKNAYNETVYATQYTTSKNGDSKSVPKKDFEQAIAPYQKAKVLAEIYKDDYHSAALATRYSFQLEKVLEQLIELAAKSEGTQAKEETQFADWNADELVTLQQKLAQSLILEIPYSLKIERNFLTYFNNVEIGIMMGLPHYDPKFFTRSRTGVDERGFTYYDRAPIDQVIYDFYGAKVDTAKFNELAGAEGPTIDDFHYLSQFENVTIGETYPYRQLKDVKNLENDFIALQYDDYSVPWDTIIDAANESALIAASYEGSGYLIFKRVPLTQGTQWAYIDTVASLEEIDMDQYKYYASNLYVTQQLVAEQKAGELNAAAAESMEQKQVVAAPVEEPKSDNGIWQSVLALFILGGIAAGLYWHKRKSHSEKPIE